MPTYFQELHYVVAPRLKSEAMDDDGLGVDGWIDIFTRLRFVSLLLLPFFKIPTSSRGEYSEIPLFLPWGKIAVKNRNENNLFRKSVKSCLFSN